MNSFNLGPDLEDILDRFVKFQKTYIALKTQNATQEKVIKIQRSELDMARTRANDLLSTFDSYQQRQKLLKTELDGKNRLIKSMNKTLDDKKFEYVHSNTGIPNEYHNSLPQNVNNEHEKLEEELELTRIELAIKEEEYKDNMLLKDQKHQAEIREYEKKLKMINMKMRQLTQETSETNSSNSLQDKKDNKIRKRQRGQSQFRWPELTVKTERRQSEEAKKTVEQKCPRKKKKLYNLNNETMVDIAKGP
ncbi:uncharacterized protein LOC107272525 isoform X2 [Cephus cinctus]|uniref:Uncharacterized protein LOC107272525 isoform X2 n=1 Tax=Cephus cinctus TaxID=211228 RepID=A0AAJ7W5R0_CEPCN|nr:uncharacterized protein LOC107272525 isoform X2 [Cephus cinctus]